MLQIWKLRPKHPKELVQSDRASKWQGQDSNPDVSPSRAEALNHHTSYPTQSALPEPEIWCRALRPLSPANPFLECQIVMSSSSGLSRETEQTGCIYREIEIYFKELVHMIVRAWQVRNLME